MLLFSFFFTNRIFLDFLPGTYLVYVRCLCTVRRSDVTCSPSSKVVYLFGRELN